MDKQEQDKMIERVTEITVKDGKKTVTYEVTVRCLAPTKDNK